MYTDQEKIVIWLSLFNNLSASKHQKLFALYDDPRKIYMNLVSDGKIIKNIVGEQIYYSMINTDISLIKSYIQNLDNKNIKCVTCFSDDYPQNFREIAEAPPILFCKGDLSLLNKKSIAIVGTRSPTAYARGVTEDFAKTLSKQGLVIVSGLASGVDKIAHESALRVGGKTIAVLAGGFDEIYPAMNTNLAKEIAEKGLIVTEYKPNVMATKYSFPYRNRLISGLSAGVLITEAGEKSGSIHTKNYALEQGKSLFVVPANINNPKAVGTNKILKSMQGAMVLSPSDILLELGMPLHTLQEVKKVEVKQGDVNETLILKALEDGEQTLESLQEITKLETKILNSCLTIMQIRGLIKKLPGNSFSI